MGRVGRVRAITVGIVLTMGTQLAAQAPATAEPPVFTVVSVKPNTSGSVRSNLDLQRGGRFTAINVSVLQLVRVAYGDDGPLTQDRLAVSDAWSERRIVTLEKYDILATAERELAQQDLPRALRQLLADRFRLAVHRETRAVPSYDLVLARSDGRLGPGLRRSSIDCTQRQESGAETNGRSPCGFQSFPGKASGRVLITDLARRVLPAGVSDGRPIEDKTGLQGTFEFALDWTPDAAAPARPPDAPPAPPVDPNGASFVSALREQLGLKLEARTGSIDVLVVDRAERPSPD
jgi:uncharacterized protein (TIGR03435 family)